MSKAIKIDWLKVFGEIIMITISILLAFELDQWNDRRNQREAVVQYRESMVEDLKADRMEIKLIHQSQEKRQSAMDAVQQEPALFLTDSLYQVIMDSHTFYPKTGTYYSLKSTGDFRMMRNHVLRRRMSNLYEYMYERNEVLADYSDDMVLNHQQIWHEAILRDGNLLNPATRRTLLRIIKEEQDISKEYTDWLVRMSKSVETLIAILEQESFR